MSDRINLTEATRKAEEKRRAEIEERRRRIEERQRAAALAANSAGLALVSAPEPAAAPPDTAASSREAAPVPPSGDVARPNVGRPMDAQHDSMLGVWASNIGRPDAQQFGRPTTPVLDAQHPSDWAPNTPPTLPPARGRHARYSEQAFASRILRGRLSLRLRVDILERLEAFCSRYGCDRQEVIEEALERFLGAQTPNALGAQTRDVGRPTRPILPHDDHDDHDDDQIIIIYEQMTGNRATARDRRTAEEIHHFRLDLVRQGIALSMSRARTKINSLRYCQGAIEELARKEAAFGRQPALQPAGQHVAPPSEPHAAPLDVYGVRTIAQRFREAHKGDAAYTRERLKSDVRTALGADIDEALLEEAIGA
jgi:hypothetical protein